MTTTTTTAPDRVGDDMTPSDAAPPTRTGRLGPWLAAAAAFAALACLPLLNLHLPGVLPGPTYTPGALGVMALCLIYGALALSYHLLYGVAGMLSFGHALYFAAGAYGLAVVLQRTDMPLLVAACLVLVAALALAVATGAVALRVSGIPFAMVTLAFAQAGNVVARRNVGGFSGGEEGIALTTAQVPAALVGVVNVRNVYWLALAVLVVVYVVVTWFQSSRAGHVVAATRENELRVRVIGQQPYLIRLVTFAVAGTLAALVGMTYLVLQSQAVPMVSSAELTIQVLVMVVLGGVGSRWGAVVGAVVYTLLSLRLGVLAGSAFISGLPPFLRIPLSEPLFILGLLFVLVVIFVPGGLAGGVQRARASVLARVRRRRTAAPTPAAAGEEER